MMQDDPARCGWYHSLGRVFLNYMSGETELTTSEQTSEHASIHFSLWIFIEVGH